MKPGWKTSEFWITIATIASNVLTVLLAQGIFPEGSVVTKILTVTLAILSSIIGGGYIINRGMLKSAVVQAQAEMIISNPELANTDTKFGTHDFHV